MRALEANMLTPKKRTEVRFTARLTKRQDESLTWLAPRLKLSKAELVRRAIDALLVVASRNPHSILAQSASIHHEHLES